jgi:hypothetical protein
MHHTVRWPIVKNTKGGRTSDVLVREPVKPFDREDSDDWCGMVAVQVKPGS